MDGNVTTSPVILNILSAIIYDGMKRPIKKLREQAAKNKSIYRALQGNKLAYHEKLGKTKGTEQLAVAIGNLDGRYTWSLEAFLK